MILFFFLDFLELLGVPCVSDSAKAATLLGVKEGVEEIFDLLALDLGVVLAPLFGFLELYFLGFFKAICWVFLGERAKFSQVIHYFFKLDQK